MVKPSSSRNKSDEQFSKKNDNTQTAQGAVPLGEIKIPLEPPYAVFRSVKEDEDLVCDIVINWPQQCFWCESKAVAASRPVQLYAANPRYLSRGKRAGRKVLDVAVGTALTGSLSGGIVQSNLLLKPSELIKIKGFAFNMAMPHCAKHGDTELKEVLELSNIANDLNYFTVRMREAERAGVIAHALELQKKGWDEHARIKHLKELRLPTLEGLTWPGQCVVCGAAKPTEQFKVEIGNTESGELAMPPICATDLEKLGKIEKPKTIIGGVLVFLFLGLGIASFWLDVSLGWHFAICLLGLPLAMGVLLWLAEAFLIHIVVGVKSEEPVKIWKHDQYYELTFSREDIAEAMFRLNYKENG